VRKVMSLVGKWRELVLEKQQRCLPQASPVSVCWEAGEVSFAKWAVPYSSHQSLQALSSLPSHSSCQNRQLKDVISEEMRY